MYQISKFFDLLFSSWHIYQKIKVNEIYKMHIILKVFSHHNFLIEANQWKISNAIHITMIFSSSYNYKKTKQWKIQNRHHVRGTFVEYTTPMKCKLLGLVRPNNLKQRLSTLCATNKQLFKAPLKFSNLAAIRAIN